jgi:hypothetical protein
MINELAHKLLGISDVDDNMQILEIINIIYKSISKMIICKAAIIDTPITFDDFKDVSKSILNKHFKVLEFLGILMPILDKNVEKLKLTAVGKDIAEILNCN